LFFFSQQPGLIQCQQTPKAGLGALGFVICDAIDVSADVVNAAMSRIQQLTGVAPQNVLISATHTHTGPGGESYPEFRQASETIRKGLTSHMNWPSWVHPVHEFLLVDLDSSHTCVTAYDLLYNDLTDNRRNELEYMFYSRGLAPCISGLEHHWWATRWNASHVESALPDPPHPSTRPLPPPGPLPRRG
jgi:hypothetical protein